MTSERYVVYGMDRSYFSRKLEAAMQWYGLPFDFTAKTMVLAPDIESKSGTRQVPVLVTPEGEYLRDTTPILLALDERVPERRMFPPGTLGVLVHLVEEWFDEWLPRTALHYRWNFPDSAEKARADIAAQIAPEAQPEVQATIGQGIQHWGTRACRATGMSEAAPQRAAEDEYRHIMTAIDEQLKTTRFLLGDRPCVVDAVVLGGLRAHFDADPAPRTVIEDLTALRAWLDGGCEWDGAGELAPFPESTGLARVVLAAIGNTLLPYALANRDALTNGDKAFVIAVHGNEVSYRARPYVEESRQMIATRVSSLDATTAATVAGWLDDRGLAPLTR
jgi:glutathione S-transferase